MKALVPVRAVLVMLAAVVFATDLAAAPAPDLPRFPKTMSYARVRQEMIKRGYDPQPIVSRRDDPCDEGELSARCGKWPEVEACSADGFCNFLFRRRRDGRYLFVTTRFWKYDEFRGISWVTPADLSDLVLGPIPRAPSPSAPSVRPSGGR
jgi:hypothetical protein